jgi:ribosomal RNA-processing protein 12
MPQELNDTFTRVASMLESSVASEKEAAAKQGHRQGGSGDKMPPTSHTLIDLVIAMSIYLPRSSFSSLFAMASAVLNGQTGDQQLIKKAYKLIPRLASTETGTAALRERSSELQALILSTADKTPASARRDRMLAVDELITYLPTSDLHFIPSILSEVVLGCKESNEKARTASFDLLIHLAERATNSELNPPGTKIRNSLVPHMPDNAPDAPATMEEFFTMVSAGLAGSSPHMVAASVTALSRLFFDFHTEIQTAVRSDLVQTVELFLTSNNREIVRSVLGFIKVAVVVLPDDILRARLNSLVPNLMVWSKEHKGRLRSKVKGILDRLIRRFGAAPLEELVGEADRKLVVNIRKQRERRKKKKQGEKGEDDEDDEDEAADSNNKDTKAQSYGGNAFDRAVYDSDFSDSDDDASELDVDEHGDTHAINKGRRKANSKKSQKQSEQYIREMSPEDNPLDLLAPDALASISTTKPSVRFLNTGPGSRRKHSAKVDEDGRLLLGDENEDVEMSGGLDADAGGSAVNAYVAAVSGPDAVRRGQRGKFKMAQAQKAKNSGGDDMDLDDEAPAKGGKQQQQQQSSSGRRGLGMPKTHGPSGGIQKRRNVHPARGRGSGGRFGRRR